MKRITFGPPGLSYAIDKFNIYDLLRYNNSAEVKIYPHISKCCYVNPVCACFSKCCVSNSCACGLRGIFALVSKDTSRRSLSELRQYLQQRRFYSSQVIFDFL